MCQQTRRENMGPIESLLTVKSSCLKFSKAEISSSFLCASSLSLGGVPGNFDNRKR